MEQIIMKKNQLYLYRCLFSILFLTILIGCIRFGTQTPDSANYIALTEFFKGTRDTLPPAPFAFRILPAIITAILPIERIETAYAVMSLVFTVGAYFLFIFLLDHFKLDAQTKSIALFLMVFSFPTVNYSSRVLTDPVGFFLLTVSFIFLVSYRYYFFIIAVAIGVMAREANLVILPVLWFYYAAAKKLNLPHRPSIYHILVSLAPLVIVVAIRYIFREAGHYIWVFSLPHMLSKFRIDTVSTFALTILPPLILILYGYFYGSARKILSLQMIKSSRLVFFTVPYTLLCIVLIIYSTLTACISGRFVWPIYLTLIPFTAIAIRDTWIERKLILPVSGFLFPCQTEQLKKID
jgi:hypothetical protein